MRSYALNIFNTQLKIFFLPQVLLTITLRTKICVALVQRPPRATSDARQTLWRKKSIFGAWIVRRLCVTEPYSQKKTQKG